MNKRLCWNFEINSETPLTLPACTSTITENVRWESRFFWPESDIIVLYGLDEAFLHLSNYQAKHRQDIYCLLPTMDCNLKIRRGQLLYKPVRMKTSRAVAYEKKINLDAPDADICVSDTGGMNAETLLAYARQEGLQQVVSKEALIYRFDTQPSLKLELARLSVADTIWFSVNIESRSEQLVQSVAQQVIGTKSSCDYVSFLKGLL